MLRAGGHVASPIDAPLGERLAVRTRPRSSATPATSAGGWGGVPVRSPRAREVRVWMRSKRPHTPCVTRVTLVHDGFDMRSAIAIFDRLASPDVEDACRFIRR